MNMGVVHRRRLISLAVNELDEGNSQNAGLVQHSAAER